MLFIKLPFTKPEFRIIGSGCFLKPLKKKETAKLKIWFKDRQLIRFAFGVNARDEVLDQIAQEYLANFMDASTEVLGIWTAEAGLIGFINYFRLKNKKNTARIGIILSEEKYRSCGIGTAALNLALHYIFNYRGIDTVELDTADFNVRARRCFEKCGFKPVRDGEELEPLSGKIVSKHYMCLYKDDFINSMLDRFELAPTYEGRLPSKKLW